MYFTFKKNNKQTKKPVNCFLQDDASAGIQSLQTSIEIKLCQNPWNDYRCHFLAVEEKFSFALIPHTKSDCSKEMLTCEENSLDLKAR